MGVVGKRTNDVGPDAADSTVQLPPAKKGRMGDQPFNAVGDPVGDAGKEVGNITRILFNITFFF